MSSDLTKPEIDLIVDGLFNKLANDQAELLRELQEARKELSEANETIGTFNELRELLPAIKQFGISFNPQAIQQSINSCVRGECRRLNMHIRQMKDSMQPQIPPDAVPPQPDQPPIVMYTCVLCGREFPRGSAKCPHCYTEYSDW